MNTTGKLILCFIFLFLYTISIAQKPEDPVWGVYASGVGEPLKVGMDPCWVTYTVGLVGNAKIQQNINAGLMGQLAVNINWYQASALQRKYSRYFDDEPDGTYKLTPCEYPYLAGRWMCTKHCPAGGEGKYAKISQNGLKITFTNEGGDSSSGKFLSRTKVVAGSNWNNIQATLSADGKTLTWSNGTVWVKQ